MAYGSPIYNTTANYTAVVGSGTTVGHGGSGSYSFFGVSLSGAGATVQNSGTILGYYAVVNNGSGGLVTNAAGAYIGGYNNNTYNGIAVGIINSNGVLLNAGTIKGESGVDVGNNGTVINQSGGIIDATYGRAIFEYTNSATGVVVKNYGSIEVTGTTSFGGIYLKTGGGTVINETGGVISALSDRYAISIGGGAGSVTNAGTIDGGITLAANAGNRLIVDPGAAFDPGTHKVNGGTGVLELASAGSAGTLDASGATFTSFSTLTLDSGATWLIKADSGLTGDVGTIAGFAATDTIQFSGSASITGQSASGGVTFVTLSNGATLDFLGAANLQAAYSGGVTNLTETSGPTLTTGGAVTFTGGGSAATLDATAAVTDSNNITGATIAIVTGLVAGDQLNFTSQSGITGSFDAATGTLVLTGNTSAAAFQSALDSIIFSFAPNNGDPTNAGNSNSRTIHWQVTDASGSSSITSSTVITSEGSVLSYGQTIDETGIVATSETVSAGVMTLFSGASPVGTLAVGGTVSTPYFMLASDGASGTDVIVDTVFGTYASGVTLLTNPTTIAPTGKVSETTPGGVAVSAASGTAWTLVNQGAVSATGSGHSYGVWLPGSSVLTNTASGTITGYYGGVGAQAGVSVVNAGTIQQTGTAGEGIRFASTGSLGNSGLITAANNGVTANGLTVNNTGTIRAADQALHIRGWVENGASGSSDGLISGSSIGAYVIGPTSTIINYGTITGSIGISGGTYGGVQAQTIIDSGAIIGTGGTAIALQTAANLVKLLPGFAIQGTVNGGSGGATLELASAGSAGTISGLGTQFVGFAQVTIDSGAQWVLSGNNSIALGETLTNAGTDTVIGTLVNAGRVTATGLLPGIYVGAGGFVSNQSGGTIAAYTGAIVSSATGTLVNSGRISAASTSSGTGVKLANGGSFTNTAGGTVTGDIGIYATGASAATIVNAGSVNGLGGGNNGVDLLGGGVFTNLAGGTVTNGAFFLGVAGTLVNAGLITGTQASVSLTAGGTVVNQSGGTLSGSLGVFITGVAGTVFNSGTIAGNIATDTSRGVVLNRGGFVSNASSGTISGHYGIYFSTADAGSLSNAGTVLGDAGSGAGLFIGNGGTVTNVSGGSITGFQGVMAQGTTATVTNAGSIGGANSGSANGVYLRAGGALTNQTGGIVSAYRGVDIINAAGTVVNTGTITGAATGSGAGIQVGVGGTIDNQAGGTVTGKNGLYLSGAVAVTNAGSIGGATNGIGAYLQGGGTLTNLSGGLISGGVDAVKFAAAHSNRLVVAPSASFTGTVDGGNTIGAASTSTLELASAATAGTLHGFGSEYINFSRITIDAGAQWDVVGSDAASALGGATITGFTYGDTIDVTNFAATGSSFSGNQLTLTSGASSVTLDIQGNFITQQFSIGSDGGTGTGITLQAPVLHYGDTIDEPGTVASSETVSAGVMTLFNSGNTAVGSIDVGTSLSTGDFLVSNNGTNSTIVVDTVFGTYASGIALLTNPTTIAPTGNVSETLAGGAAVSAASGTSWTLVSQGVVSETGSGHSYGILLPGSSILTNASGGMITGYYGGVGVAAGDTVVNAGTIRQTSTAGGEGIRFAAGGSLNNSGLITSASEGVSGPDVVDNSGTIEGTKQGLHTRGVIYNRAAGLISGGTYGIYSGGLPSTIHNYGTITGGTGVFFSSSSGVQPQTIVDAGTIIGTGGKAIILPAAANLVELLPSFDIQGAVEGGAGGATLELASAGSAGTISGIGTQFAGFTQVTIDARADWGIGGDNALASGTTLTNSGTDMVTGTLTNAGLITGGSEGIVLGAGGYISNQSGGVITASGVYGVAVDGPGAGTVVNAGSIVGNTVTGFGLLTAGGLVSNQSGGVINGAYAVDGQLNALTVVNAGSIGDTVSVPDRAGVRLYAGGMVANQSGGLITGLYAVYSSAPATITNAGSISGTTDGIVLSRGGTITNQSGGTITGGTSGSAPAVTFASGYTNRLVVDPGAKFVGAVDGGNAIGSATVSTLELASAASTGTLLGFGSQYVNFGQITFDAGAHWDLTGLDATTALAGATISGFTYGDTIDVTNFAATGSTFSGNHLTLTSGASSVTLDIQGNFITQQFRLGSDGSGGTDITLGAARLQYGDTIDEAGIVATSETVNNGTLTLFNGVTQVGSFLVGGTVNTSDFYVTNNGTNSQVIVDTVFGTYTSGVTLDVLDTTIAATASVANTVTGGAAVYGPSGTAWTLINYGQLSETTAVLGTPTLGNAISFASAGTIINASGGMLTAAGAGIVLSDGGVVTNLSGGTITADRAVFVDGAAGTVLNGGVLAGGHYGVWLHQGGAVTNLAGGTISGSYAEGALAVRVDVSGTVSNAGVIDGAANGSGVYLGGGLVTNLSGGVIAGYAGVELEGGSPATLINAGLISGASYTGVLLGGSDQSVTNLASGTITGALGIRGDNYPVTVVNAGSIGGTVSYGLLLLSGGSVTNLSGGTINGASGIAANSVAVSVVNAGSIGGTGTNNGAWGIMLDAGGSVSNEATGTISGYGGVMLVGGPETVANAGLITGATAISLSAGGQVSNATGGTIAGGTGIYIGGGGTVQNAGSIGGTGASAVELAGPGVVTNQSGGVISSAGIGVQGNGPLTLVNAGAISGNSFGVSETGPLTLVNSGAISGSSYGVQAVAAPASITNQTGGTIAGGIFMAAGGTVSNAGSIGASPDGVVEIGGGSVTNASGGTITGRRAIYVAGTGTVSNSGSIGGATTSGASGISLAGGGSVSNAAGGTITGYAGILSGAPGTVDNSGAILGGTTGTAAAGVWLQLGTLTNQSGGSISGRDGVYFGAPGTLSNAGVISGNATSGIGVDLANGGGSVTNQTGGTITGLEGIAGSGGVTLTNAGFIDGSYGVSLAGGGLVTNQSGATIVGGTGVYIGGAPGTVQNAGYIGGTAAIGVQIASAPGTVVNLSGGTIKGATDAVSLASGASGRLVFYPGATFVGAVDGGNTVGGAAISTLELASAAAAGTLSGLGAKYVDFAQITIDSGAQWTLSGSNAILSGQTLTNAGTDTLIGTLVNQGLVTGSSHGIYVGAGGVLTNQSGGTLAGQVAVYTAGSATIVNAGLIAGAATTGNGIYMYGGGLVTNLSGGTITGGSVGLREGSGTIFLTNAGTIIGTSGTAAGVALGVGGTIVAQSGGLISGAGDAVKFGSGHTSRLVIDPGAVFSGTVDGGNSIGAGSITTLELASGASAGTIHGVGSQYINFGQIVIDTGAQWDVVGSDATTALGGATISGFAYGDTIDLTNFAATGSAFSGNHLTLTSGASSVTLDIQGNFITQQFRLGSDGSGGTGITLQAPVLHYGDTIDEAGIIASSETVNAGTLALFGSGITPVGTINVGTSLSTGDFLVTNNGTNSQVIVDTVFGTYTSGVTLLTNPTTIAPTGSVSNTAVNGKAVSGPSGTTWTLVNDGQVTASQGFGVSFAANGTITNAASATIAGYRAVYSHGVGMLQNAGSIRSTGTYSGLGGVYFKGGGSVTNQSGGTISGTRGIALDGTGANTVVNFGIISGSMQGRPNSGIWLEGSGSEQVTNLSGGTISGASGIYANGGMVVNAGDIFAANTSSSSNAAVNMSNNGVVTNQSGGTLSGFIGVRASAEHATVANAGIIAGNISAGQGVYLIAGFGAAVTNQSGGTISGMIGVKHVGGPQGITLSNDGVILGSMTSAYGAGIEATDGGYVTNQAGGTIAGYNGVLVSGAAATVANAGFIDGSYGVSLGAGGLVTNASGGTIIGGTGVFVGGGGTVQNAGYIGGTATAGVAIAGNGTVANLSGGTISGYQAIAAGTTLASYTLAVVNAGLIAGSQNGTIATGIEAFGGAAVTNASGGTITGHNGIQAGNTAAGTTVTVNNAGLIAGYQGGSGGVRVAGGIALLGNATIANQAGGTITGYQGVVAAGTLTTTTITLDNAGLITGSSRGTFAAGAGVAGNGTVNNLSGGTISGRGGILGGNTLTTTTIVVNNAGLIAASQSGTDVGGIALIGDGTVSNVAGGTISGYSGISDAGTLSALAIDNAGLIIGSATGTQAAGIFIGGNGAVRNLSGGTITGYQGIAAGSALTSISVVNAGYIAASPNGSLAAGIDLVRGGSVTNLSGATITGYRGIMVGGTLATATVVNAGTIGGNMTSAHAAGVELLTNGSLTNQSGGVIGGYQGLAALNTTATIGVVNAGIIIGNSEKAAGFGVEVAGSGSVTNLSGGRIGGAIGVVAYGAVTVINAGQIIGAYAGDEGVFLANGARLTNLAGGVIAGTRGVVVGGSGTVSNAGTIGGNRYGDAVQFLAGGTDRLVIDPGAVFVGGVDGGNTIGAIAVSTLELASGTAAGTLSGLGSQFVNFAQTTIDTNANWTITASNTVVAGATLTNTGTFTDAGTLDNAGTFTGNELRLDNGSFTNLAGGVVTANDIYGVAGSTNSVLNQGTIANTIDGSIYLNGAGNVTNAAGAVIDNSYGVKLKGDGATLVNQGQITATATAGLAYAAYLRNGGTIVNGQGNGSTTSTASMQGYYGVVFKSVDTLSQLGTLLNYGTIAGAATAAGSGAALDQGGVVVNGGSGATGALIKGARDGVYSANGSVTNYGTIIGTGTTAPGYGVNIDGAGTLGNVVSNLGAAALIKGYVGVAIGVDGTVINQGTIASSQGTIGTAVSFTGGNARLIEAPTATLIGGVYGGTGGTAVLELASGAGAGTISGLGTNIRNFTSLVFDSGADWTVAGNDSANGLGTLGISGFTYGDTIDLTNFIAVSRTFSSNALVLTNAANAHETLNITGSFVTNDFQAVSDGSGGTDVYVRQIPSITAGDTANFTGGGSPVALDPGLTVTDAVSTTLASATVWINSGFIAGDILSYTSLAGLGITGSFDAATGTLTLSGTATVADYQTALESVTYSVSPSDTDPTNGGGDVSRTISWMATDGTSVSQTVTSTLDVVHVAPSVTASGTVGFAIGGMPVALDAGIVVADPDSGGVLTGATIAIANGFQSGDVLSFVNSGSITGSYNPSTGTLVLTGTASIAGYETALASITYGYSGSDPSSGALDPTRTITWSVTDGSSSNGLSNIGTTGLNVYGPPPVIGGTSSVVATYIQQGSAAILDGSVTVADGDSTTLTGATVTINGGYLAGDTLAANTSGTSITAVYNNGTLTLSGADTLANYQQVLRSVTYASSAADPTNGGADFDRTITWQVNDGRGGNNLSNLGTTTVDAHVRPVVTAGVTETFGVGGGPILVDPALGVADADTNPIATGTVAITSGLLAGDVLTFNNGTDTESFGDGATLSASFNNGTLTFTDSGSQASAADWQRALASVTYNNPGADPSAGGTDLTRTLTWTLNTANPAQTSASVTSTVDVARPPIIAGTVSGQTTTDEAAISPFSGVSITDLNIGQTETVTITLSNAADGTLASPDGGTFNNGTYVVTGSASTVTAAVDELVFTPTAHQVAPGDTVTTGFTLSVTDTDRAISSDSTTSVIATAVNDPPTIVQSAGALGDPNEDNTTPFSVLTVRDPDVGHNSDVLTVTLSNPAGGTLSNLSGGSYDAATGVYTLTGSAAQLTAALAALVFAPAAPPAGDYTATTTFTVKVSNTAGSATNGGVSVTAVAQDVPGVPGGATSSTISVSPDGSNFAPATPGETNEAIISAPSTDGTYTIPDGYQAAYLGGNADATLSDNSVNGAVLVGNSGNDTLSTGADDVTLTGGAGNNDFRASGSNDVIGVTGNSSVSASGSKDTVYAGNGSLTLSDSGSNDAIGLSSGSANLNLNGSGASVFGSTGSLDVVDHGSGDVIGAGSGPVSATLGGSGTKVYGGSGLLTLDVANSASNAMVGIGMGDASVTVGGARTTVYGGGGSLTADVTGNDALIGLNRGPASLTLTGSNAQVYGGSGDLSVVDLGANNTIGAGLGSTTVSGGGSGAVVVGGGGDLTFIGGAGSATVVGASGSTSVAGGSGPTTLYGTAGSDMTETGGTGSITYQAGQGNETLQASGNTSGAIINGGIDRNGHDVLIGGSGNDSLFAGTGAETLSGGAGHNEFVFYKNVIAGAAPNDVITDFNANDTLYLAGYGTNGVVAAASGGGGVTITLSDSTRITFSGLNESQLLGHIVAF